ncbi:hypothetical protein ACFE04_024753 [Oxalis oulophora]
MDTTAKLELPRTFGAFDVTMSILRKHHELCYSNKAPETTTSYISLELRLEKIHLLNAHTEMNHEILGGDLRNALRFNSHEEVLVSSYVWSICHCLLVISTKTTLFDVPFKTRLPHPQEDFSRMDSYFYNVGQRHICGQLYYVLSCPNNALRVNLFLRYLVQLGYGLKYLATSVHVFMQPLWEQVRAILCPCCGRGTLSYIELQIVVQDRSSREESLVEFQQRSQLGTHEFLAIRVPFFY